MTDDILQLAGADPARLAAVQVEPEYLDAVSVTFSEMLGVKNPPDAPNPFAAALLAYADVYGLDALEDEEALAREGLPPALRDTARAAAFRVLALVALWDQGFLAKWTNRDGHFDICDPDLNEAAATARLLVKPLSDDDWKLVFQPLEFMGILSKIAPDGPVHGLD